MKRNVRGQLSLERDQRLATISELRQQTTANTLRCDWCKSTSIENLGDVTFLSDTVVGHHLHCRDCGHEWDQPLA